MLGKGAVGNVAEPESFWTGPKHNGPGSISLFLVALRLKHQARAESGINLEPSI